MRKSFSLRIGIPPAEVDRSRQRFRSPEIAEPELLGGAEDSKLTRVYRHFAHLSPFRTSRDICRHIYRLFAPCRFPDNWLIDPRTSRSVPPLLCLRSANSRRFNILGRGSLFAVARGINFQHSVARASETFPLCHRRPLSLPRRDSHRRRAFSHRNHFPERILRCGRPLPHRKK